MTGQEHYQTAESLMKKAARAYQDGHQHYVRHLNAQAQVHATLALVQATLVGMEMADWDKP